MAEVIGPGHHPVDPHPRRGGGLQHVVGHRPPRARHRRPDRRRDPRAPGGARGREGGAPEPAAPRCLRDARPHGRGPGAEGELRRRSPGRRRFPTLRRPRLAVAERTGRGAPAFSGAPPPGGGARPGCSSGRRRVCWPGPWPSGSATNGGARRTSPLIDEAEHRLTGVGTTYGHIVVDEAQDLSTMALRMLRAAGHRRVDDRRGRPRPGHPAVGGRRRGTTWPTSCRAAAPVQRAELTIGYRTPAPRSWISPTASFPSPRPT